MRVRHRRLLSSEIKMQAKDLLVEFYDPASDQLARADYDDSRRPRLTMLHLQKLRRTKDARRYDRLQHMQYLPDMYGTIDEPAL